MSHTSVSALPYAVGLCLLSGSIPGFSYAQAVGHGQIDWSNKTITATGSGAPNLKADNVAVARLGAERAAKMDAFRNILEAVKGVQVSKGVSAGAVMDAKPEVKSRVEGAIRNFRVLDTKYYSDGGVDVIVQVPLDGVLTEVLLTNAGQKVAATPRAENNGKGTTGVVINAKGLRSTPALAPRLTDEQGHEVFSAAMVSAEAVKRHGVVGYAKSLDGALKNARVAGQPLIIKATKLAAPGSCDLVITNADGEKIGQLGKILAEGKIVIVTD